MLPDSFLTELKYRCDIEQIISSYVMLKRAGRNLKGLCPFHSEKTPSCVVYPESQSFYCFGCGAGGDVVTFIRKIENLEYLEAVRLLAQRVGMPLPEEVQDDRAAQMKNRILSMNKEAARFFHQVLISPQGKPGLDYLLSRGLTRRTITRFGLGYAPDSWDSLRNHLKGKGYSYEEMAKGALVNHNKNRDSYYDAFRGRVIFPIIDLRGNVIAFGGRILGEGGPKYLNSGDTPVFKKSRNLFAMNFAKSSKENSLILCEGYLDVVSVHQAGFDNAVATLGTALTPEQARLISQYTNQVILAYDSDGPGQAATRRAIGLFEPTGVKVRVLTVTQAKDPDEFIKKFGPQRFRMLMEGSANATEYEIAKLGAKYDRTTEDGKVNFLREFCQLMAGISSPVERDVYIGRWAAELSVSREAITQQVTAIQKQRQRRQQKKEAQNLQVFSQEIPVNRQDVQRARNLRYALAEDKLIVFLMRHPDCYEFVAGQLGPDEFVTDSNRKIFTLLCDRLARNLPVDMMSMASQLEEDSMSRLSWQMASSEGIALNKQEAQDYINTIKKHALQKEGETIASMDDKDLEEYIKQITANKK